MSMQAVHLWKVKPYVERMGFEIFWVEKRQDTLFNRTGGSQRFQHDRNMAVTRGKIKNTFHIYSSLTCVVNHEGVGVTKVALLSVAG